MRRIIKQQAASKWTAATAAALVAVLGVTGCGQLQLGAAALYSNNRISSATLTSEVANLNAGYQAAKSKVQIGYTPADMSREVLSWMLRFATIERLAAREHITVTPAQAQAEINLETRTAQQSGDTLAEAAVLNGLPPNLVPELGRWIAIEVQLENKIDHGVAPKTSAANQAIVAAVTHLQCVTAKSMNIKVNPQYGAYDYRQFIVVPVMSMLAAAPGAPRTSATLAPQLAPHC